MRPTSANLRRASRVAAALPALLGLVVLLGWAADIAWLRSGVPGYPPMMPNTALALALAGVAAWAGPDRGRWPRAGGILAAAIGVVTLFEFATVADTGANHLLFHDATASLVTPVDARPVPRTAACLALIGCAVAAGRCAGRRAGAAAEACALATLLIALPVLIEYAYAAIPEPVPVAARGMSLPTALAACLLAASLLAAHPSRPVAAFALGGHEGSRRFRRLLPAFLLAPIALRGAGILLEPGGISRNGSANLAALMAALVLAVAAWDGRRVNRLDARHRRAVRRLLRARRELADRVAERTAALSETVESLRASEERTRSILENLADAVVIVDDAGLILSANPAASRVFGHGEGRLEGQDVGVLMAEPERSRHAGFLARYRPGGGSVVGAVRELTGLRGDGSPFPMELSVGTFALRGRRYFSGVIRDLTPRRRAEKEARRRLELQEQLAMVTANVPGAICSFRVWPDGRVTMPFATAAIEELYGFPPEVLAADFSPVLARVHPDDHEAFHRGVDEAFRGVRGWQARFRYQHPAGGERWIEGRASARAEPDGSVLWHGFVADVTDRHRVEEARRESERLARSVLDSLPDQVAVVDEGGEILAVNRAWRGFAAENGAEGNVSESVNYLAACEGCDGEDRSVAEAFARGIRDVLAGAIPGYEAEYPCHSPERRRWFLGRVTPFSGDGPVRAVISHQDVTGLKLAEERLREGEERFRTLADGISQFAWMADPAGRIYWYNGRWYEYTGADEAASLGRGWEAFLHPEQLGRVLAGVAVHLASGEPWEETFQIRSRAGEYRWFLTRAMPVRGPGGGVARWFGTNTDITERKELEARLTEADRRKDQFLAMLGHEIRNPLATIAVAAEALCGGAVLDRSEWAGEAIRSQVAHLARLLDDLLDVARITRGAIRLARRPVEAGEFIDRVACQMRPSIEARRLQFDVRKEGGPLDLEADPDRIEQVLTNLLANAAKYTPSGGQILLEAGRCCGDVVIRVADTGAGIDPVDLPRLFEPFAQGARTLDRSEGGLGVGLSIAAELARLHGGRIEASSAGPGLGSEFRLILPAAATHAEPPAEPGPPGVDSGGPARVLIVDDNRDLALGLTRLLQAFGHEAEVASDGPAGLEAVRSWRPDVVLLDLGLPILDGFEVARRLRADPDSARLPIVAVSGYAQEEDRRHSAAAGIDEHLAKPVDIRALDRLIRRLARRPNSVQGQDARGLGQENVGTGFANPALFDGES